MGLGTLLEPTRASDNLGSSLNAVVVFNIEVTHAARFALKTTNAFNEEPKKENLAGKAEENGKIIAKNSRFSGKNRVISAYFCSQSTKSDIFVWEITRKHKWKPTERIG